MEHPQGVGQVRHKAAAEDFLARCLLLDLETDAKGERLLKIGALRGSRTFERKGRFDTAAALEDLEGFAAGAPFCLGHNLLDHDLPVLRGLTAASPLLALPVGSTSIRKTSHQFFLELKHSHYWRPTTKLSRPGGAQRSRGRLERLVRHVLQQIRYMNVAEARAHPLP